VLISNDFALAISASLSGLRRCDQIVAVARVTASKKISVLLITFSRDVSNQPGGRSSSLRIDQPADLDRRNRDGRRLCLRWHDEYQDQEYPESHAKFVHASSFSLVIVSLSIVNQIRDKRHGAPWEEINDDSSLRLGVLAPCFYSNLK
jgi:hypothetical protein